MATEGCMYAMHEFKFHTSFMQQSDFSSKSKDADVHQNLDWFGYMLGQIWRSEQLWLKLSHREILWNKIHLMMRLQV